MPNITGSEIFMDGFAFLSCPLVTTNDRMDYRIEIYVYFSAHFIFKIVYFEIFFQGFRTRN
jgi:hypothetical protein